MNTNVIICGSILSYCKFKRFYPLGLMWCIGGKYVLINLGLSSWLSGYFAGL